MLPAPVPAQADGAPSRPARLAPALAPGVRGRSNLSWLVQLHWWAILGQVVVVAGAEAWTGIGLPMRAIVALVAIEVVGNLALGAWAKRAEVTDGAIAAVMLADVVVLTVLLDLTGGSVNPFSTLYLVNIALASVLLPPRLAWALSGSSLLAFGSLFLHERLTSPSHHLHPHPPSILDHGQVLDAHMRGMWIAFALAAVFIVFFIQRVAQALRERERELSDARAQGERREKLASLATLAAGAAHELSTPLGTIAIVAKELSRALAGSASEEVKADLVLVRDQVARCREILDRMAAGAGEHVGEAFGRLGVREWIEATLDGFRARERVQVEGEEAALDAQVLGPRRALSDALRGLVKNAVQASDPERSITLRVSVSGERVRAEVVDRGRGMAADVLARVGEPFFTTKGPGEGMGLGLFLTRALAEQLGGGFHIASRPGVGTTAWIELPAVGAGEGDGR
jgi:two-component system sensor histidine kinase RegB